MSSWRQRSASQYYTRTHEHYCGIDLHASHGPLLERLVLTLQPAYSKWSRVAEGAGKRTLALNTAVE